METGKCVHLVATVCILNVFLVDLPEAFGFGRPGWMDRLGVRQ